MRRYIFIYKYFLSLDLKSYNIINRIASDINDVIVKERFFFLRDDCGRIIFG